MLRKSRRGAELNRAEQSRAEVQLSLVSPWVLGMMQCTFLSPGPTRAASASASASAGGLPGIASLLRIAWARRLNWGPSEPDVMGFAKEHEVELKIT